MKFKWFYWRSFDGETWPTTDATLAEMKAKLGPIAIRICGCNALMLRSDRVARDFPETVEGPVHHYARVTCGEWSKEGPLRLGLDRPTKDAESLVYECLADLSAAIVKLVGPSGLIGDLSCPTDEG